MKSASRICLFVILFTGLTKQSFSQTDTTSIFKRISTELKNFHIDTTEPPNDKLTKKIAELRTLRGGFSIDEAIQFKLGEEKEAGKIAGTTPDQLKSYFTNGHGYTLLTRAVTWIYRNEFSLKDVKQLVKFYKTNAGQKLSARFPIIMLESLAAAELIMKGAQK